MQNYYRNLRERAIDRAEHYKKIANADEAFRKNEEAIKATEIRLAKAEALGGETTEAEALLRQLKEERAEILARLSLREEMLVPQFRCKLCNDTGFDKDGNVCECYKKFVEGASAEQKLDNILEAFSNIDV